MTRNVVVLFGISGVGKTTFLKRVSPSSDFLHLQASELIKMQFKVDDGEHLTSEQLREGDIESNQMKLAIAFLKVAKDNGGPIVLDGHSMIDASGELILIEPSAIAPLEPTVIVFLEDIPEMIFQRRSLDISRKRPTRSALDLQRHQEIALKQAKVIADNLALPIVTIKTNDLDAFVKLL